MELIDFPGEGLTLRMLERADRIHDGSDIFR